MKLISLLLRYSPGIILIASVAGVISGASNAGLLAVLNSALHKQNSSVGKGLLWQFIALCLLVALTRIISSFIMALMAQRTVFDLRLKLCQRILSAPSRKLEELGPHRLLVTLTQDIGSVVIALGSLPHLCINTAIVTGSLIYLGWLSWNLLLAMAICLTIGVVGYQLPVVKAARRQKLAREEADKMAKHFRGVTEGYKELKLHLNRRRAFLQSMELTGKAFQRHNIVTSIILNAAAAWGDLLVFGIIGSIIFLVPAWQYMEPETLVAYTMVILYMTNPLQALLDTIPDITRANIAVQKIESVGLSLEKERLIKNETFTELKPTPKWERIELRGVTHSYHKETEENNFTLGPIDLAIYPGELVFIVGGNGSGKTTLAKLLVGLYRPEAGEILLDGLHISDKEREFYMQHFSVVFSDFYLFDSLLGLEKPELDERARDYLIQLQLDRKVEVRNGVLSSTDLSQGQRKRLALLTAYLEDRPIYVFDEWAADQDPLFKQVFYFHLLPELRARGKTAIVITHDDRYYGQADRILKLDYGKMADESKANDTIQKIFALGPDRMY
jgi:putative ATP-binding cassette transporter